jgi:tetratricopeptide (TPR) repeat protein
MDGTIRVWGGDGADAPLVFSSYVDPKRGPARLALSPDGRRIVTANRYGTAWVRTIMDWPETRALLWEQLPDILTTEERIEYLGEAAEKDDSRTNREDGVNTSLVDYERADEEIRLGLRRGGEAARAQRWPEAAKAYAEALNSPRFHWKSARARSVFGRYLQLQMGTAFVRAGDREHHERLCKLVASAELGEGSVPKTADAARFAKLCYLGGPGLPADLLTDAQRWARFALENRTQDGIPAWTCNSAGMVEHYAGNHARALEILARAEESGAIACRGSAMTWRAMALNELDRHEEAADLLRQAEELLKEPLETGTEGAWWDLEICRMALEEARQLIGSETAR